LGGKAGLCVRCKGYRMLCGLSYCPLLQRARKIMPVIKVREEFESPSPPSFFVGHRNYPKVLAGPLLPPNPDEISLKISSVEELFGKSKEYLLQAFSSTLRVSKEVSVRRDVNNRDAEKFREISLSIRSVDTEVKIEKIAESPKLDDFFHPLGPTFKIRKIDIASNPAIPKHVDEVMEDRMKAEDAVYFLYKKNYYISYIQRAFSSGAFGVERRFVPTRWSITAVDDIVGRKLLRRVRKYETIDCVEIYESSYLGNFIKIILFPRIWSFEMLESWEKGSFWTDKSVIWGLGDYEGYWGRRDYASNITGAYYAARLAVLESLDRREKQASALVLRRITKEYDIPMGVWVVRETARDALRKNPLKVDISEINKFVDANALRKSRLLRELKVQKNLEYFFGINN